MVAEHMPPQNKNKNKNNTIRTDEPTPGILALIGDSRASLSRVVGRVDHTGGRS
jgi:hypothetical protein